MPTLSEAFTIAVGHHQAGRLPEAENIYRQILAAEPNHAQTWHLLGVVNLQRNNHDVAAQYLRRAIALDANQAVFHTSLGNLCQARRELVEAAACYRRVVELSPNDAEAHHTLGSILQDLGQPLEAVACYRRTLAINPDIAEAHNNLGNLLYDQGRIEEATACYRLALALKPNAPEAHHNLGSVLQEHGQLDEAIACYRRALELDPNIAAAHNNLGNALRAQGKRDEAIACYRRALELNPKLAETSNNLGNALRDQKRTEEAIACYRRALELKPDYANAYNNLGNAYRELKRPDESVNCYRRAVELKPDYLATLGALVFELQHLCQWSGLDALARRVVEVVDQGAESARANPMSPFSFLTLPTATTAAEQLRCARQWVDKNLASRAEAWRKAAATRPPRQKSRISIGYLSADLQTHATAMLIAELFERHDRDRFAIFAYSYGPDDGGPMRARLAGAVDRFVDVRDASFLQAAERIAADEVDILVDLKGYTVDARTQIAALRPAPVQVSYLGYPGTMGAPFVDYILVDDFVVPADQQPFFTEKLVHLPGCYQVNDSRRPIAEQTPTRGECGLPETAFVFCCFNNTYKITPAVFDVWMRLLGEVPGSVLWLFEANPFAADNLRREAQSRGIAPERLVFAPRLEGSAHLARHRLADLFLDTFPVNAHTTASDALWAGCPLVTLVGETFVSRVAGSLLRALGLSELATKSLEEYQALALRLARDPGQLSELRTRLAANRATSALFDGERFARSLEQAYSRMWELHTAGEPPRAFRVDRP